VDATEHTDVTTLEELSEGELKHHHGETQEEESEQVGDEEDTTTPLEAEVRETPEVTESNGGSDSGEDERHTASPPLSWGSLDLILV
jgi:hypothetical protein